MDAADVDISVFDPNKLKKAIADIEADPGLSKESKGRLDREIDILRARFDAISDILVPLLNAYHKDRKRKDPKYNPDRDSIFESTYECGIGEMRRIQDEIDKLSALRIKILEAQTARYHVMHCAEEIIKLLELTRPKQVTVPRAPDTAP